MNKSVFSKCYGGKSIIDKKFTGILTVSYDKEIKDSIIGPKLKENSTKKEVAEKIRQLHAYFYIHGSYPNHENIPVFPKYEKEIIQFPFLSYIYSNYFMKKPWKEAEESIALDPWASLLYSINILKKRFELGENSMKDNPEICLSYCIRIMKRKTLPKVMHQAMLLNSLKDSCPAVKRYFSYKGVKNTRTNVICAGAN